MESVVRVKRSLRTPMRKLTSCVSGVKDRRRLCARRRSKRARGGGGWRGGGGTTTSRTSSSRLGRTPPLHHKQPRDPATIRSYQADLERERKLREAMNAQKNAERAAMRAHFRRKYQLSESSKDVNHLRSVGGKVSLPRELSKIIHPEANAKADGFNLLSAFQGLGFGTAALAGSKKHSKTSTPTPTATATATATPASCKVM